MSHIEGVKKTGTAEGIYYPGVSTVLYTTTKDAVVLCAIDIETLERTWADLTNIPFDNEKTQHIAIFRQTSLISGEKDNGTELQRLNDLLFRDAYSVYTDACESAGHEPESMEVWKPKYLRVIGGVQ